MQKKILSSLLLASALPFNVHALGLGDIEVYSALNQPLDAEITITSAKPGETESLLVKLASEQAFLKSGVERPFMLTKLKFRSSFKADGTPIIKVTSPKAVREPFLNFLVDVEWPRGRLVREYTVLLDPPSFTTRTPATTASPEVTKAAAANTAGSAPIQREPAPVPQENTSVYGFAEPEPNAEPDVEEVVEATYQEVEEEAAATEVVVEEAVDEQLAQVEEVLAYEEPLPNEETIVETVELETQEAVAEEVAVESDSPFSDLLNDIQGEESVEFDENAFAPTAAPEVAVANDDYSAPAANIELDGDIPEINMSLDESIPFNAETILAADNAYIDPEIESLLRGDDTLLYRAPEPEVVVVEPEPVFVEPVEEARPDTYTVEQGDMMLQIAEQFRPEEVDINQAMLAIMRYNPEAFIQDNVNLVRKGQVLRIPDEEAMRALSQGDALAEVQGQNALWREYRAQLAGSQSQSVDDGTQTAAVASDTTDTATASDSGTQLALMAPGKDDAGTDFASGQQEGDGELRRLERNLALAKEKLVASNLEQTELQSRIAELEQIATQSEGVINLKNQQLAQIQANAEQANDAAGEIDEAVQEVVADEGVAADDLLSGEGDLLAGIEGVDESIDVTEADAVATDAPVDVVQAPVAITEPNAATARPSGLGGIIYDVIPPSLRPSLQPILSGPLLFVILAAIILLPLLLIFLLMRKKKTDEPQIVFEEEAPAEEAAADADMPAETDDVDATMSIDSAGDEFDTEATMVSTVAQTAIEPEAPAEAAADDDIQDDTTAEVDVYIAYGLHDQAEELLKQSISDNPDMTAYRGKLLETYFNAGKKDEFINEAQELNNYLGGRESKVWDKAVVMGKEIAPDNMLFSDAEVSGDLKASDFAAAKPDMADLDLGAGDDGADIDLGAADIDLDIGDGEPEQAAVDASAEEDEFSLDDVAAELDAAMDDEVVEAAGDDELEFDVADFIEESDGSGAAEADVDLSADMDIGDSDEASADLDLGADLDFDMSADEEADIDLGDDAEADVDLGGLDELDGADDNAADIDMDFDAGSDALDLSDSLEEDLNEAAEAADLDADIDLGMDLDDADSLFEESVEEAPVEAEASNDGLDFDMADLDDLSAGTDELSADDTQGLDDSLFDDDADSTQMIDDESLETMIDDIESDAADFGLDDDMPDNLDEVGTKLDLAKAYIDMGDADGAKASLEEVIQEGNDVQKKEAEELLAQI